MSFDRAARIGAGLGIVCVLALSGCSSAPPPPGQRVNIGGLALHVNCTGPSNGQPTVIIEAGLGEMSAGYHWVQAGVSKQTRVCTYDRAGLGWSERSSDPRDAQHMVHELHSLLDAAHIAPPYVLAGHSLGGLLILADAALVDSLDDRPVVVITAGQLKKHSNPEELAQAEAYVKVFSELHSQYAGLSSRGRQVILPNAGHMSLVYDKNNAADVVRNILEVVHECAASTNHNE